MLLLLLMVVVDGQVVVLLLLLGVGVVRMVSNSVKAGKIDQNDRPTATKMSGMREM